LNDINTPLEEIELKATTGKSIYAKDDVDVQAKVKTPAQPEAVRVKSSISACAVYLDSSVPT
jgi:hypothetical protein